jgi:hypothetical protein
LGEYKPPEAHYEDKSWFVFFEGRVPMPGNFFSAQVNDMTGEVQVRGGM